MNTVTISAAVSAIVTVLVGTALNWGERVVSWVRRRYPPDHLPISGVNAVGQAQSATDNVRVVVCCAPNRSLKPGDVHPEPAIQFVRSMFPGRFPFEPVRSMPPYGVRFEAPEGVEHGYVEVLPTGCVEFCVSIPTTPGPVTFAICDVVEPLVLMRDAMCSEDYERVFGSRRRRLRRPRFDWAVAVSQSVFLASQASGVTWQDLTFPGRRPPRAGTNQMPSCPMLGYAAPELRNWNVRKRTADLVRVFLRDFLQQNGFHDVEPAIEDTLAALSLP
jgi:hypothetical protein